MEGCDVGIWAALNGPRFKDTMRIKPSEVRLLLGYGEKKQMLAKCYFMIFKHNFLFDTNSPRSAHPHIHITVYTLVANMYPSITSKLVTPEIRDTAVLVL